MITRCVLVICAASLLAFEAMGQALPVQKLGRYEFQKPDGITVFGRFDEARQFSGGFAAVRLGSNWGFINLGGNWAISPQFESVQDFSGNFAAIRVRGRWGYIDTMGTPQIPPQFLNARPFSEGLAGVQNDQNRYWIFIGANGEQAVPGSFDGLGEFSEGIAPVAHSGDWEYINKSGKRVIQITFAAALPFSEDLAAVKPRGNDKYGYIRRDGEFAISPQFDSARSFSDGYAAVQIGERWGYVNKDGKLAIVTRFNTAEAFKVGLAEVSEPSFGKSLYINKRGGIVLTKSMDPEPGKFAGYTFITNTVDSNPKNAIAFIIPQPDWTRMSPEERTNLMYQATGRTKLQVRVQRMPLMVLAILPDGRQAIAPFNPITATTNYVFLTDFK